MNGEGKFYACISLFLQGCSWAEVSPLRSVSLNKTGLGRYVATQSVLQCGKVSLYLAWRAMEDRSWHWAAGLMLCPVPLSLTVVTGGKPDIFCWILPKPRLPFSLTRGSELGVSLVFTYSDQEWVWGLLAVTASAGFSLGGPGAPAPALFLGQPEPPWDTYREQQLKWSGGWFRTSDLVYLINLWKNKFLLFL